MKTFYPIVVAMFGMVMSLSGRNDLTDNAAFSSVVNSEASTAEEMTDYVFNGAAGINWTEEGSWTPSYPGVDVAAGHTITIDAPLLINTDVDIASDVEVNANVGVLNGVIMTQKAGALSINSGLWTGDIFSDAGSLIIVKSEWRIGGNSSVLDGDLRVESPASVYPFNSNRNLTVNGNLSGTGRVFGLTATEAVILNGEINPGDSPGCLNVSIGANNNSTATNIEINGAEACTEHDRITTINTVDYYATGTLNVTVGYTPTYGDAITIVSATNASVIGTYETVNTPENWTIAYNAPNEGEITLTYTGCDVTVGELEDVVIEVGGPEVPLAITTPPTGAGPFTYLFELAGAAAGLLLPTEVAGVDPADPSTYPVANPDNLSQFFKDRGFGNTFYNVRVMDANGCESDDFYRVRVDFITDPDDDGVGNHEDNCPGTFNPDQADSDEDGTGDVCDDTPNREQRGQEVVWQMHHGQGEGIFVPGEGQPSVRDILTELYGPFSPQHGDAGGYQYASIPAADDPVWEAAPVDPEDGQLCFRLDRSRLDGIMMALDFTYFQTSITVSDTTLPFIIRYMAVDDGVRAYVFNSSYPEGAFLPDGPDDDPIPDGDARLYHTPKEADLSSLFVEGENRIVLVQFDNAATENYLKVVVPPYGEADPCSDDTEAPLMDLSGIVLDTLECVSPEEAPAPVAVLATDNCDPDPAVESVVAFVPDLRIIERDESFGNVIDTTVLGTQINWIYTATDASGNVSVDTVSAYYIPVDREAPDVDNCPADTVTIELDSAGQVLADYAELGITVSDNCTALEELEVSYEFLDLGPNGQFLDIVFTDANGNLSGCSIPVNIASQEDPCENDTEAPAILECPSEGKFYVVEVDAAYNVIGGQEVLLQNLVGEDGCSQPEDFTLDFTVLNAIPDFPSGDSVTLLATFALLDAQGNESEEECSVILRALNPNSDSGLVEQEAQEEEPLKVVSLYPNPLTEHSIISITVPENAMVTIDISDLNGQVVHTARYEARKGIRNDFSIQTTGLREGLYFITVKTTTTQQTIRAVITR